MTPLRESFIEALPQSLRPTFTCLDELQARLEEFVRAACEGQPTLRSLASSLPAHVAARLDAEGSSTDLPLRHAGDLLVALGCVRGDPAALAVFFAHYTPEILRALRRLNLSASARAELQQDLHARLLVGGDRPPLLDRYRGSGSLRRWLQATAINTALKRVTRERLVPVGDAAAVASLDLAPDPELALLRETYRAAFDRAIGDAIAALSPEQRLLLHQHFVDGSSIDVLARLYRVHRATAARRLARARSRLYSETRELLQRRLDVGQPTFRSLCRLLVSQLDLSLAQLAPGDPERDRGGPPAAPGGGPDPSAS
jgi:RNA polymerase sigma-70 factor (ECF subfamily)